jgi:hypothetical protein
VQKFEAWNLSLHPARRGFAQVGISDLDIRISDLNNEANFFQLRLNFGLMRVMGLPSSSLFQRGKSTFTSFGS